MKSDAGSARKGSLMSQFLKPPPPPTTRKSQPRGDPLNLEKLFMKAQSPPTMLESPSITNARLMTSTAQPQIQNRRMEVNTEYGDKYNGFWNMLHKPETNNLLAAPKPKHLNLMKPRVSGKSDRILSMQDELQHLLELESQQNSQGPSLYQQIQSLDDKEIQELADQLVPILDSQNANTFSQSSNSWRKKPTPRKDPVSINNFGSSGFKKVNTNTNNIIQGSSTSPRPTTVVDIHVPEGQATGFFGVGSSLSFSDGSSPIERSGQIGQTNSMMNSVASLHSDQVIQSPGPLGSDPNIVYPQQIRAGTEMLQGPGGPLVASPRPLSLAVPQTPLAPQVPHPDRRLGGSRLSSRPRLSGQAAPTAPVSVPTLSKAGPGATRRVGENNVIGSLLPAAIGLSSSAGISPIGIFSNLLNAYATIDSKHDLTGKLINSAASWFQESPETGEVRTSESIEVTTQSTSTPVTESHSSAIEKLLTGAITTASPLTRSSTPRTRRPVTNISVRVHDSLPDSGPDNTPYQSIFDKIRAAATSQDNSEYDVVTSNDFQLSHLPVKSNLFHDGPLRAKPPSDDIIQVSPSAQDYDNTDIDLQYGVSNPHWYSNEVQVSYLCQGRKLHLRIPPPAPATLTILSCL